jgi:hypothetical protein
MWNGSLASFGYVACTVRGSPGLTLGQKVASAWSRSNLPPPELDKMFRGIEQVYKANRSLVAVSRNEISSGVT